MGPIIVRAPTWDWHLIDVSSYIRKWTHLLRREDGRLLSWHFSPICHVFAYICANTPRVEKNDFSQLWVWKKTVHFLPSKVISFPWGKKLSRLPKFHTGEPLQTGSNASLQNKSVKSQTFFWRVLGIPTSWILFNLLNHSKAIHFQKEMKL